jgi:hypothetical protein
MKNISGRRRIKASVGCVDFPAGIAGLSIRFELESRFTNCTKEKSSMKLRIGSVVVAFLLFVLTLAAQTANSGSTSSPVPPLVNFNGVLADTNGKPLTGTVGVTFYLYQEQQGGAPLWLETQNVQADKTGHYSVALGSASSQGLPASLFASGEARWLGVEVQGHTEQPRVLLMSVPYALKALDAETIGGKPASAFMMTPASNSKSQSPILPPGTITGSGTADFVPVFTGASTIGNSKIFQTVGGDVGIGTTTPAAVLDVKGTGDVRDTLTLFPKLTHPSLSVHGTAFEVSGKGLVTFISGQTFPGAGTVTSVGSGAGLTGGPITGSGTLSIKTGGVTNAMLANSSLTVTANSPLTGGGGVSLGGSTSLSLKSCSTNQILQFISGAWACANPATGTVTSVGSGLGLSGGPITGSGTLTINTSVVPQLAAANTFTANQTVTGTVVGGTSGSSTEGVLGEANASSGQTYGVAGFTASPAGFGVDGYAGSSTGSPVGVYGQVNSTSGIGVFGQNSLTESVTGGTISLDGYSSGVWGDGGSGNVGVVGTVDNGTAGIFANNSAEEYTEFAFNYNTNGYPFVAGSAGGGYCQIDPFGDISCTGSKNALVPIDGGKRKVAMSAIESPQNWFEDFGSAQLSGGSAVVALDSDFIQTVNTEREYMVIPVPNGECKGLYVTNKTATSFEVRELGRGTSSIRFDYRIVALRKKYENVRFADHTNDPDPTKMLRGGHAAGVTNRQSHMPTKNLPYPQPK